MQHAIEIMTASTEQQGFWPGSAQTWLYNHKNGQRFEILDLGRREIALCM